MAAHIPSVAGIRLSLLSLVAIATCSLLAGCDTVKFYEKRTLSDPIMVFGQSPTEAHFVAKNTYSREGSVGGIGSSAGGGCGCY